MKNQTALTQCWHDPQWRWVVGDDFPADARHAFLQARAQHHRPQLQRYDPRPVKTGLYFLMLGAWVEVGAD